MVLSSWRWYIWLLSSAPGGRAGTESPVDHLSNGHQVAECSAPDLASRVNKQASTNGLSSIRKCAKCSLSMVVGAYEAKDWAPWSCISNIETQSIFHNNLLLQSKGLAYISSRSQKLVLAVWHTFCSVYNGNLNSAVRITPLVAQSLVVLLLKFVLLYLLKRHLSVVLKDQLAYIYARVYIYTYIYMHMHSFSLFHNAFADILFPMTYLAVYLYKT